MICNIKKSLQKILLMLYQNLLRTTKNDYIIDLNEVIG